MKKTKEGIMEKRKHDRYQVRDGFLVFLGPSSAQIGKIMDIGLGGLSFLYKKNDKKISAPCEVSIVFGSTRTTGTGPFRFSVKMISDAEVEENIPYDSAGMKRCRLQFSELTYHQNFWLQETIKNNSDDDLLYRHK